MLTTPQGESLVAPGKRWSFDLSDGVEPIAHDMKGGRCVAFTRNAGRGRITVLGFNLQYIPNEQDDQKDFLERIVTDGGATPLATRPSDRRVAAMQLSSPLGCFVCVANPVELPATTRIRCTGPRGETLEFPRRIDGVVFTGAGARVLPVGLDLGAGVTLSYATWELLANESDDQGGRRLTFSTPGVAPGEIHVVGAPVTTTGLVRSSESPGDADDTVLVLEPTAGTCWIGVGGGPATADTQIQRPDGGSR